MVCIYCSGSTAVLNSRLSKSTNNTWRRRGCKRCKAVFTTWEQVELQSALRVKKSSGSIEPFLRDKLFLSIFDSLSHRKSALTDANGLAANVIVTVLKAARQGIISSASIVKIAEEILKRFDKTAAVYYRAHH